MKTGSKTLKEITLDKIKARCTVSKDNCWIWTGGTDNKGYGRLRVGKRQERAHRVSYSLSKGEIPDGKMVLHSCDNPPCCNPAHLFAGTHEENMEDAVRKGRKEYYAKLTPETTLYAAILLNAGVKKKLVAKHLNVNRTTIFRALKKKLPTT